MFYRIVYVWNHFLCQFHWKMISCFMFDLLSCLFFRCHRILRIELFHEALYLHYPKNIYNFIGCLLLLILTYVLANYIRIHILLTLFSFLMFCEIEIKDHDLLDDEPYQGFNQSCVFIFNRLWWVRPTIIQIYQDDFSFFWWPWGPDLYVV